jgi:spore coat polysaccharide biosynthesis protein SpsF
MGNYKTEQEQFWAGEFGSSYIERNCDADIIRQNTFLFSRIIPRTQGEVASVIELGANIGLNLQALKTLLPEAELSGIEINHDAAEQLRKIDGVKAYEESILDFKVDYQRDMSLIKTVLIHINPEELPKVYDLLYESSRKYICISEFYNPSPVEVNYRGHTERLFKRDFAGEMLDRFDDLELVDYGFCYHRDKFFPKTDTTWFLLRKTK